MDTSSSGSSVPTTATPPVKRAGSFARIITVADAHPHPSARSPDAGAKSVAASPSSVRTGSSVLDPTASALGVQAQLFVSKEDFKFSAAHMCAHEGGRERLHGHNYRVSLLVDGRIGSNGYVVDFGVLKAAMRSLCAELDERFLCPTASPCISVVEADESMHIRVLDGSTRLPSGERKHVHFMMPSSDVALLPIANTTCEEIATYIARRLVADMHEDVRKAIGSVCVGVSESPGQEARVTFSL